MLLCCVTGVVGLAGDDEGDLSDKFNGCESAPTEETDSVCCCCCGIRLLPGLGLEWLCGGDTGDDLWWWW